MDGASSLCDKESESKVLPPESVTQVVEAQSFVGEGVVVVSGSKSSGAIDCRCKMHITTAQHTRA